MRPRPAVPDTNVLVSGLLTPAGDCSAILNLIGDERVEPCFDDRIFREYEDVLARPELGIEPQDAAELLALLRTNGRLVVAPPLSGPLPDSDDQAMLEVAAAAGAVLVTGNMRHFPAHLRHGVVVLAPREFLDHLRREG